MPTGLRLGNCEVETSTVLRTRDGQDAFAVVVSVTNTPRLELLQGPSAPVEVTADRAIIPLLRRGAGARVVRFREPQAAVEAMCANQLGGADDEDAAELCRSLLSDVQVPVFAGGPDTWRTLGQVLATKGANTAVVVNPTSDGSPLHLLVMTDGATVVVRIVDPADQAVGQGIDSVVRGWFTGSQAGIVDRGQVAAASGNGRGRREAVTATVEPMAGPASKPAKRAPARKAATRKRAAAKKAAPTRKAAPVKKQAAKKATKAARPAAKKASRPAAKRTAAARTVARKAAPAKKASAPVRKATVGKAAPRKAVPRKAAPRKAAPRKATTARRAPTTRPAAKKAAARRTRRTASARGSRRAPRATAPRTTPTPSPAAPRPVDAGRKFSVSLNLAPASPERRRAAFRRRSS
jgi:hypothetical protein